MSKIRSVLYVLSLPERTVRATAASLGGLVYETAEVILPGWFRRSRLYRAMVAGSLRIAVEFVGGVTNVLPPELVGARELAVRKAAGSGIEMASVLAVGWSPLWLLAAAADLTGGTRVYLQTLVSELQRGKVLSVGVNISSVQDLLEALEGASTVVAEAVDVPPLNVRDMRTSWRSLRQSVADLPDARHLARIFSQLQHVSQEAGRPLWSVSSLIALGAIRAGMRMGQVHVFDYYRDALGAISREGLRAYAQRVAKPYLDASRGHYDRSRMSFTERVLTGSLRRQPLPMGADAGAADDGQLNAVEPEVLQGQEHEANG